MPVSRRSLVSWASKKQNSITLSTIKAEYISAGQCCAQLLWMRQTLKDFDYNLSEVSLLCDNESAIRMADNPIDHDHTKHIDIWYHFLRDHSQREDIIIDLVSTHVTPGFRRQTECEPCTCQDQQFTYTVVT
jgi:asparagine synthetase A